MVNNKNILITGAAGQLGQCFRDLATEYPDYHFIFLQRTEIGIDETEKLKNFLRNNAIGIVINCAAYTKVDLAEQERELAMTINAKAPAAIASICKDASIKFIHFSTDYVFPGTASKAYTETDATEPVNFYGLTKLEGEKFILENNPAALIIRTSWVYSPYGKNFVKTMASLLTTKEEISVVNDQFGCPTYAVDLADTVMQILGSGKEAKGIYHYCNSGIITWYVFASAIKNNLASVCKINPVDTLAYPTPARRPAYSALSTNKIEEDFEIKISGWEISLSKCMRKM